jgi:hypothetical protein
MRTVKLTLSDEQFTEIYHAAKIAGLNPAVYCRMVALAASKINPPEGRLIPKEVKP